MNSSIDSRIISFNEFLKGSHKNDTSLIKFLPKDILEIIWNKYVITNFTLNDMVKYGLNNLFIR